jgi:hypothetical protein
LQQTTEDVDARFFGLHSKKNGAELTQGDTIDDIGDISALDEDLSQSQRYIETENEMTLAAR